MRGTDMQDTHTPRMNDESFLCNDKQTTRFEHDKQTPIKKQIHAIHLTKDTVTKDLLDSLIFIVLKIAILSWAAPLRLGGARS